MLTLCKSVSDPIDLGVIRNKVFSLLCVSRLIYVNDNLHFMLTLCKSVSDPREVGFRGNLEQSVVPPLPEQAQLC
jgi:hypothetical protein